MTITALASALPAMQGERVGVSNQFRRTRDAESTQHALYGTAKMMHVRWW